MFFRSFMHLASLFSFPKSLRSFMSLLHFRSFRSFRSLRSFMSFMSLTSLLTLSKSFRSLRSFRPFCSICSIWPFTSLNLYFLLPFLSSCPGSSLRRSLSSSSVWSSSLRPTTDLPRSSYLFSLILAQFLKLLFQLFFELHSFFMGHWLRLSNFFLQDDSFLIDVNFDLTRFIWRWSLLDGFSQFSHFILKFLNFNLMFFYFLFRDFFAFFFIFTFQLSEISHDLFHFLSAFSHLFHHFGINIFWPSVVSPSMSISWMIFIERLLT